MVDLAAPQRAAEEHLRGLLRTPELMDREGFVTPPLIFTCEGSTWSTAFIAREIQAVYAEPGRYRLPA